MLRQNSSQLTITAAVATSAAAAIVGVACLWYRYKRDEHKIPVKWKKVGKLEKIAIYPIKSCGYKELQAAECTESGVKEVTGGGGKRFLFRDRAFLIYNIYDQNAVLNLFKYKEVVTIKVSSVDEDTLCLEAPGTEQITFKLSTFTANPKPITVERNGYPVDTVDCGDEVAQWLSQYILQKNEGFRLGYFLEDFTNQMNVLDFLDYTAKEYRKVYKHIRKDDAGLYASLTSYLVVNNESLNELNKKLPETDRASIYNFRPNLVVSGGKSFEEDQWKWIKIGNDVVLRYFKPCSRCVITTVNADTGERNKNYEPFKSLKSFRSIKRLKGYDLEGDKPAFGLNMGLYATGTIKLGDSVYASA